MKESYVARRYPIGSSVVRVMTDDYGASFYVGNVIGHEVEGIGGTIVVCRFTIDVPRTMRFNDRGVNMNGHEYGCLVPSDALGKMAEKQATTG